MARPRPRFYTFEDFRLGNVKMNLFWGYTLDCDVLYDKNLNKTYAVWVSDENGDTIAERECQSEEEGLDAIRTFGLTYGLK